MDQESLPFLEMLVVEGGVEKAVEGGVEAQGSAVKGSGSIRYGSEK